MDIRIAVQEHLQQQGYKTNGTGTVFLYAEGLVQALRHGIGKTCARSTEHERWSGSVTVRQQNRTEQIVLYWWHH